MVKQLVGEQVVMNIKENRPTTQAEAGADESVTKDKDKVVDWRQAITEYLKDPGGTKDRKIGQQEMKYTIMVGNLYRHTVGEFLLKCLGVEQSHIAMGEVHKGLCGMHQSAFKMKWELRRAGLYWPTMVDDCIQYQKGCDACQRFGYLQSVPASLLHPIIKPWSFRGWELDFIGEIHPSSSKGH
jgi:hypothetical protein